MQNLAIEIVSTLQRAGFTAYFAGGCVRDHLLGSKPEDFDVATNAIPSQVLELFPTGKSVGAHFGVIVVNRGGHIFEIATFRTDGSYSDGRRPESVEFSTPEEDAQRRDFTINGLFYDPIADEIIDFVGGRQDIAECRLRAIGDPAERLAEDYLRLLRAVRFAARLGYEIEPATWSAITEHSSAIRTISIERIRSELDRILVHPSRLRGFDLLVSSGLMAEIIPEVLALRGCEQPPLIHPEGDVFDHTRLMLSLLRADASLPLALAVLLHDIAKPATYRRDDGGDISFEAHEVVGADMAEDILRRLKHSNMVIERTRQMVARHMEFFEAEEMRVARLRRFMNGKGFADELELHRLDALASNGDLSHYDFLVDALAGFAGRELVPQPWVTGADLLKRKVPAAPVFKELLTEAHDLQLEDRFEDRPAALAWLDLRLRSAGL